MADQVKNDQKQYAFGYSEIQTKMMEKRGFEYHCQFLRPYLKPGMRILDCGCGPGTLTIGLARTIAPGEVVAIDIEEEQLNIAYKNSRIADVTNIEFKHANIFDIPFEDNTFDVVFSQAVLIHLKDPIAAIKEQKRVTKPGGVVAVRDPYRGHKYFIYPSNKLLEESLILYHRALIDDNCDMDIGIKLAELFTKVSFKEIKHTLFCDNYGSQKAAEIFPESMTEMPYSKKLLAAGEVTLEQLKSYQQAWVDFGKIHGAYYGFIWGEAIGIK